MGDTTGGSVSDYKSTVTSNYLCDLSCHLEAESVMSLGAPDWAFRVSVSSLIRREFRYAIANAAKARRKARPTRISRNGGEALRSAKVNGWDVCTVPSGTATSSSFRCSAPAVTTMCSDCGCFRVQ